jgi:hypothetical protein
MRILVKNQISGATNGIYVYNGSGSAMTRSSDFSGTIVQNMFTFILSGNTNKNSSWILSTTNPITLGVTPLTFVLYNSTSGVIAGNGISSTLSSGNYIISTKIPTNSGLCTDTTGIYVDPNIGGIGICYNNSCLSFDGANIAGNSLNWSGTQLDVNISGGTLNTSLGSKVNTSLFNSYTGQTQSKLFNKVNTSLFNLYTGTTEFNQFANKSTFNSYTGVTAPNTYYNKSQINQYTGETKCAINLKANIDSPTFTTLAKSVTPSVNDNSTCIATTAWYIGQAGTSNPIMDNGVCVGTSNLFSREDHIHPSDTSRLTVNLFNTFTGITLSLNYYNKIQINQYTGETQSNLFNKLNTSLFNNYTGITEPNKYYNKSQINQYTGETQSNLFNKLDKSTFNLYTGTTVPNTYYNKIQINQYTGETQSNLFNKLNTLLFNNYTGVTIPNTFYNKIQINGYTGKTRTELNLTITGTTNLGSANILSVKSGRNLTFKSISGGTGIAVNNTANLINICSTTVSSNKQIIFNNNNILSGNTNLQYCYSNNSLQLGNGVVCSTNSAIIGGNNNIICNTALRSAIIGGTSITLNSSIYNDTTAVQNLAIWNQTTGGTINNSTLFWNSTDKLVKAIQLTGGSDSYLYVDKLTPTSTASATCILYLSGTPWNFKAGRYQIDFNAQVSNSANGGATLIKFSCDGSVIGNNFCYFGINAGYIMNASLSRDLTMSAGCHCLGVYYWAGANTACIFNGMIRAKRIC